VASGRDDDDDEEEGEDADDDIVTIDLMGDNEGGTMVQGSDEDHPKEKKGMRRIVIGARGSTFLGVGVAEVDTDRAKELHLRDERGVEIKNVEEGSPADKAGVHEGDVVLEYNGDRVEGTAEFIRMVRETPSGREVKLLVWRDGATRTLNPTLATRKPKVFKWSQGYGKSESWNDRERIAQPAARRVLRREGRRPRAVCGEGFPRGEVRHEGRGRHPESRRDEGVGSRRDLFGPALGRPRRDGRRRHRPRRP
jgi:hypothetical protein